MKKKIPDHAKRVFKGVIFDVYQWEQELYDGSIKIFEALKRMHTVVILPMQGDQIFYAEQEQPMKGYFLSLFGGRGEEGEEPLDTAKRELFEEAGLVSDDWQEFGQHSVHSKIDYAVHYFIARDCKKMPKRKLDGGEKITIHQTSLDHFLTDIVTLPNFSEFELKQEILSSFNPDAVTRLKQEILG